MCSQSDSTKSRIIVHIQSVSFIQERLQLGIEFFLCCGLGMFSLLEISEKGLIDSSRRDGSVANYVAACFGKDDGEDDQKDAAEDDQEPERPSPAKVLGE